jgi:SAM-dependent methyltransferase
MLTEKTFYEKVAKLKSHYWNEGASYRWEYMNFVIDEIEKRGYKNVCEAGAYYMPLSEESTLIEISKIHLVNRSGVIHDLNIIPYPFADKQFDCFVALQVMEHLENHPDIFKEIKRISKNIILSFPFMWSHGDEQHRGIDDKKILSWTEPWGDEVVIQKRKICIWRGL